ncbi:MAG: flagellar biosynthetic protein FliP [Pseudomonadota bacterium]
MTRGLPVVVLLAVLGSALPAVGQDLTIDLGEGPLLSTRTIQLFLLISVISIAPGLAVMITCFPFIVTVLAILRNAIGLQQSPPNMLLVSLALFLSWFVMEPVFMEAWAVGIEPLNRGEMDAAEALAAGMEPFRSFMASRLDPETFETLRALRPDMPEGPIREASLGVLIPSFMLSELSRAFQIGFVIFLPFLIIELVVAAVLMAMGMMMVPPTIVSLPFKLAFFVVVDGWALVAAALVRGYG